MIMDGLEPTNTLPGIEYTIYPLSPVPMYDLSIQSNSFFSASFGYYFEYVDRNFKWF